MSTLAELIVAVARNSAKLADDVQNVHEKLSRVEESARRIAMRMTVDDTERALLEAARTLAKLQQKRRGLVQKLEGVDREIASAKDALGNFVGAEAKEGHGLKVAR
jgi:uncharacterized coiled-coil DUF342 family protein